MIPHPRFQPKACPLEQQIAHALDAAGVRYVLDGEGDTKALDFHLPDHGLYIEVKSGHTPRISEQMSRDFNVIAVQGIKSTAFLCGLLANARDQDRRGDQCGSDAGDPRVGQNGRQDSEDKAEEREDQ